MKLHSLNDDGDNNELHPFTKSNGPDLCSKIHWNTLLSGIHQFQFNVVYYYDHLYYERFISTLLTTLPAFGEEAA